MNRHNRKTSGPPDYTVIGCYSNCVACLVEEEVMKERERLIKILHEAYANHKGASVQTAFPEDAKILLANMARVLGEMENEMRERVKKSLDCACGGYAPEICPTKDAEHKTMTARYHDWYEWKGFIGKFSGARPAEVRHDGRSDGQMISLEFVFTATRNVHESEVRPVEWHHLSEAGAIRKTPKGGPKDSKETV